VDGVQVSGQNVRAEIACSDVSYPVRKRIDRERKLDDQRRLATAACV